MEQLDKEVTDMRPHYGSTRYVWSKISCSARLDWVKLNPFNLG